MLVVLSMGGGIWSMHFIGMLAFSSPVPIAKSLAELHGGTLRLESAVGYGTTARLTLPPERTVRQTAAA